MIRVDHFLNISYNRIPSYFHKVLIEQKLKIFFKFFSNFKIFNPVIFLNSRSIRFNNICSGYKCEKPSNFKFC